MKKVRDIMTEEVESLRPDSTVAEAAQLMKSLNVGAIPVCEDDELLGILTDRDIVVRAIAKGKEAENLKVKDIMSDSLEYIRENEGVEKALKLMKSKQIRRLPVVDFHDRLVGIVSLGDLAVEGKNKKLVGKALESISESGGFFSGRSSSSSFGLLLGLGALGAFFYWSLGSPTIRRAFDEVAGSAGRGEGEVSNRDISASGSRGDVSPKHSKSKSRSERAA